MGHSAFSKLIDVYSMPAHHLFILTELVTSIIIILTCLLVHFRQHFRLQCINRHYTQPQIVSRLSKRLSGVQSPPSLRARSSIFSKETILHPEDAIQWCLRSIDDQEFDFFPRSFLWYQLFLICLLSIILCRFLYTDHPHSAHDMYEPVTRPIHTSIHIVFARSSLLSYHRSSLMDWIILYSVLILTNWEALFVFYRYYSTTYTAKYFSTINNVMIFKSFTIYAVCFSLLFVAQIHFYYYVFPFIILFMSSFHIFCSYKTSQILIHQFKQMERMLENFGSNREVQKTMSKSVYFMRNTSMVSCLGCILYLSVLLVSYNVNIVFYLPCVWSIVCVLSTLNFIRNRNFFTKLCCCYCLWKSDKRKTKSHDATENKCDNSNETNHTNTTATATATPNICGSDTEMGAISNDTMGAKTISNDSRHAVLYQKRSSKSGTATMTHTKTVVIHHDIDEHKAQSYPHDFSLGVLHDTNDEDLCLHQEEEEEEEETSDEDEQEDDAYNVTENGTVRIYPAALTREPTAQEWNELNVDCMKPIDISQEHSMSLDHSPPAQTNPNKNTSKLVVRGLFASNLSKAKSHDTYHDKSTAFAKSESEKSNKSVRFRQPFAQNHLVPTDHIQGSHRRVQSERPHTLGPTQPVPDTERGITRSPSVSKSAEAMGRPSIEGHMGNSDPVKGSAKWQQTQTQRNSHIKSMSFQPGDGHRKSSRRTLSRRLVFSKLPKQMQILREVDKHTVEEFANLNLMMTLHGFCEKNQFFQFEVQQMDPEQ